MDKRSIRTGQSKIRVFTICSYDSLRFLFLAEWNLVCSSAFVSHAPQSCCFFLPLTMVVKSDCELLKPSCQLKPVVVLLHLSFSLQTVCSKAVFTLETSVVCETSQRF